MYKKDDITDCTVLEVYPYYQLRTQFYQKCSLKCNSACRWNYWV